jgi:hypothetical protein
MPVGDKYPPFKNEQDTPIEPFWNDQFYKMTQTLYLNVLDPQYARYVQLRDELKQYLIEEYGDGIDFQICVSEPLFSVRCGRRSISN